MLRIKGAAATRARPVLYWQLWLRCLQANPRISEAQVCPTELDSARATLLEARLEPG